MSIEISHLTHVYSPDTPFMSVALNDVSLNISDGEFVGIIGHTGSGKTTLVQHINGLLKPSSGKIIVNGINLSDKSVNLIEVRKKVGLVFQYPEYQLFEETVIKDVCFGPLNLGYSPAEAEELARGALKTVGVTDESLYLKSPFELSGGQKRRVAIAGVLAMNPSILIMDEPAAGLDPRGREAVHELIRGIHAAGGVTTIMVSHSMSDVTRLCERIIVMNRGKIALSGTPGEVFRQGDELREMGLDVPPCAQLYEALLKSGVDIGEPVYSVDAAARAILEMFGRGGESA